MRIPASVLLRGLRERGYTGGYTMDASALWCAPKSKSARSRWPRACRRSGKWAGGTGSDKCPFGAWTPPRLGPSQLLRTRSKFGHCLDLESPILG